MVVGSRVPRASWLAVLIVLSLVAMLPLTFVEGFVRLNDYTTSPARPDGGFNSSVWARQPLVRPLMASGLVAVPPARARAALGPPTSAVGNTEVWTDSFSNLLFDADYRVEATGGRITLAIGGVSAAEWTGYSFVAGLVGALSGLVALVVVLFQRRRRLMPAAQHAHPADCGAS